MLMLSARLEDTVNDVLASAAAELGLSSSRSSSTRRQSIDDPARGPRKMARASGRRWNALSAHYAGSTAKPENKRFEGNPM